MSILNLLRLKIIELLASRGLMVLVLVLPPLLGLVAGNANTANVRPEVRLAVVDEDQSGDSEELVRSLDEQGWSILAVSDEEAQRLLIRQEVDGVVTINIGYESSLPTLTENRLSYTPAEGSLLTTLVYESIAAEVLPTNSRLMLLSQIRDRYEAIGLPVPDDLETRFDEAIAYFANNQARLDVVYHGATVYEPALTYLVSDYSMEVFFLAIYAILGTLTLSGRALRRRLAATRNGLLIDYSLSIVSLFLLGLVQIIFYAVAMFSLMQRQILVQELAILAVCLLTLLGLGQLLSLFHESLRLYFSLLVLLLLSVASGCFFQLSEQLMTGLGQYLPQGWALAALRGYPVLPAAVPIAAAVVCLAAGYSAQAYRTRQMR